MPPAGLARYSVPSTITPFQSITLPPGWLHSFLPVRRLTANSDTFGDWTGTTPLATMGDAATRPCHCRQPCFAHPQLNNSIVSVRTKHLPSPVRGAPVPNPL